MCLTLVNLARKASKPNRKYGNAIFSESKWENKKRQGMKCYYMF